MDYHDFIKKKSYVPIERGIFKDYELNNNLFNWQKDIVKWALKRGTSSLWESCGLGKTIQQLSWIDIVHKHTNLPVLVVSPLAVSKQTKMEGEKFGIDVNIAREDNQIKNMINITNYEILHKFDHSKFSGIVLDESSILKSFSGKYRNFIIENFQKTKYKLACTATPAPNDYVELGNHAEFCDIMTKTEMLSMFFFHDSSNTSNWILKKHASDNFWKWLSTWGIMIQKPSDIGYEDGGFNLPKLNVDKIIIDSGDTFSKVASTMSERRDSRKSTISKRCEIAADLVNNSNDQWLVWCDLNDESTMLSKLIKESKEVRGSDSPEWKENTMMDFSASNLKCLVSKPKIAGWGMNWQNCHNMIFVGLSDSFEAYYQAVRRCWRFGQKNEVNVKVIITERDRAILNNVKRKEEMAEEMMTNLTKHMNIYGEVGYKKHKDVYSKSKNIELPSFI